MSDERFYDADALLQEVAQAPVVIRLFGEDHELPGDLPALIMFRMARAIEAQKSGEAVEMSGTDVYDILCAIVGKERLDGWLSRIGVRQSGVLIELIFNAYRPAGDQGNGLAPASGATPNRAMRRAASRQHRPS